MLYDASGRPIRDVQPVIDDMLSKGIPYRIVPRDQTHGFGYNRRRFAEAEIRYAGGLHKVVVLEEDEIRVGAHAPGRFRPIIAAHEDGHRRGLTHQEILNLEFAMADEMARRTHDPTLKEDYLRWISSAEMFEDAKGNFGHEAEYESKCDSATNFRNIRREFGAEMVVRKEGDTYIRIDQTP